MKRIVGIAVLLALSLLPQVAAGKKKPPKPPKPSGYPVLPGVYRLHGTDPGLPKDDLEPLRKIIGTATVVSLGESFHTSGGYYEPSRSRAPGRTRTASASTSRPVRVRRKRL